jgi:hypothetical protein
VQCSARRVRPSHRRSGAPRASCDEAASGLYSQVCNRAVTILRDASAASAVDLAVREPLPLLA